MHSTIFLLNHGSAQVRAMAMNHLLFFGDTLLFLAYMYWITHIANDGIAIHGKRHPNTVSNAEITQTVSCP